MVGAGSVAYAGPRSIAASAHGSLVWGVPFDHQGELSDAQIERLIADPTAVKAWGRWVAVGRTAGGLRVVTGPDLVHTLVTAESGDRQVWSTQGLAALDALGVAPRIRLDRLPELVVFEYVLNDDSLLEGVRLVPECSVIDIARDGTARTWSWWPWPERLGDLEQPSSAAELRDAVAEVAVGAARVPDAWLLGTAGRDSNLVASVLMEHGAKPSGIATVGQPADADVIGARAASAHASWAHERFEWRGEGRSLAAVLDDSRWTEGLDQAGNLVGPELTWAGPTTAMFLNGCGGEIGRAFYWSDQPVSADPVAMLTEWISAGMKDSARAALTSRTTEALAGLGSWEVPRLLDLQYARGRVRSWAERARPLSDRRSSVAIYSQPPVVSALLRLPAEQRRSGSGFRAALDADPTGLVAAVRSSMSENPRSMTSRVRNRLRRRPDPTVGIWRAVRKQLDPRHHLAEVQLGEAWLADTVTRAEHSPLHRRMLRSSLSVELLSASLSG